MAWSKYQISVALLMIITGSINTLATKWADITESVGKYGGKPRRFNHPFLQATSMFLGELSCLLAYYVMRFYYKRRDYTEDHFPPSISGSRSFNPLIFLPPALCDMTATSLMYIGLNLTYASSFQMLRGALIIFTGFLSVAFLNRRLKAYEWLGIFVVMAGLVIVGVSDVIYSDTTQHYGTNMLITGDLLIIMAQIIAATQMVVEEKFVSGSNVSPLQAVGWEGLFGFSILSLLLIPMYYIPTGTLIFKNPDGQMEDAIDGFYQIGNNWQVAFGIIGTVISISFFNFAGISVTKQISATTRTVLDSIRTFIIWIFSLSIGWQKFSGIQMAGFFVLILGMFLYNNVLLRPFLIKKGYLRGDSDSDPESDISPIIKDEEERGMYSSGVNESDSSIIPTMSNPAV